MVDRCKKRVKNAPMNPVRVNLHLPADAAVTMDRLALERGLTRTAVMRQALGVLQVLHDGTKSGNYAGLTPHRENLETLIIAPL
jgi:Ribbon-helix-helix protein, copG family